MSVDALSGAASILGQIGPHCYTMYSVTFDENELRLTVRKIAEADELRASRVEYRDRQIREALEAGYTWTQLQAITGLSPRGLALAINRK